MHGYVDFILFLRDAAKSPCLTEAHAITAHQFFFTWSRPDRCRSRLDFAATDCLSINSFHRTAGQLTLAFTSWVRTSSRLNELTRADREVTFSETWALHRIRTFFLKALCTDLRAVMATDLLRLFSLGPQWLASMDEKQRKRIGDNLLSEQVVAPPTAEAATAAENLMPTATCLSTEQLAEALCSSLCQHREQWHMISEDLRERVLHGPRRRGFFAHARGRADYISRQHSPVAARIGRGIMAAIVQIQSSIRRFLVRVRCAHCLHVTAEMIFNEYLTASWRDLVSLCVGSTAVYLRRCKFSADFYGKILNEFLTCRVGSEAEKSKVTRTSAVSEAATLRSSGNTAASPGPLLSVVNSARTIQTEVRRWQARCTLLTMRLAKFAARRSEKATNATTLASPASIGPRLAPLREVRKRGHHERSKKEAKANLLRLKKKRYPFRSTVHDSAHGIRCTERKTSLSTNAALGNQSPVDLGVGALLCRTTSWLRGENNACNARKIGKPILVPTHPKNVVVPWARLPKLEASRYASVRRHRLHAALLTDSSEAGLLSTDKNLPSSKINSEVDDAPLTWLRMCSSNVAQLGTSLSPSELQSRNLSRGGNLADLCLSYYVAFESRLSEEIQQERGRILELASQRTCAARSSLGKHHESQRYRSRTAISRISYDHQVAIVLKLRDAGILR